MSQSVKIGMFTGVATVIYFLLFYFIDKPLLLHYGVFWSSMIVYLVGMYFAYKSASNNFESQLKNCFTVFLIANLIYYVFYYIMINIIDISLQDELRLQAIEALEWSKTYANSTAPSQLFDTAMEQAKTSSFRETPAKILMQMARGAIGGFLMAFGFTQLLRKIKI
ncbi:MAG: DUF4199 domain-containing protein [Saprospiraceae bacterium]|nr:DUF4199 domain-containing protein [Saprospiraceae bacterium]MBP7699214.1 DUF4199 domain-containing protein [Saprospiraceae bacterium]